MLFSDMNKKSKIVFIASSVLIVIVLSIIFAFILKKSVPRPLNTKQMSMDMQKERKQEQKKMEEEKNRQSQAKENPQEMPAPKLKSLRTKDSYKAEDDSQDEGSIEGMEVYEVGKDLDPGLYKLVSKVSDSSYYRISKENNQENINTVSESVFLNFTYVDLKSGQFLYLVDAEAIKKQDCKPYEAKDAVYENGQYLVGFDIKQGMYEVEPKEEAGYVSISLSPFDTEPILNKYFDQPITIKIKNGQFLTLSMSKLKLEK